jgi:translation initiation factor eIF-2B subunit delta
MEREPQECEATVESQFEQSIRKVAPEQRFGAVRLAEIATDILQRRAGTGEAASPDAFRQELLATGWEIIRQRPTLAPLVNLVSNVLWKIEQAETPRELRASVASVTHDFKRQLRQAAILVAEGVLSLIAEGSTIVTLSYSTTVQYALAHAARTGRHFQVIVAESRPICEGRQTAAELAEQGISVVLTTDLAAVAAISQAQLVLVGADMLTHRGVVNKTGTQLMASVARQAGVACYSLCSSAKFLPATYQIPPFESDPSAELWEHQSPQLHIEHIPCDTTALDYFTGIVTERGILPTAAIEGWLATLRIHPALTMTEAEVFEQASY